MSTPSIAERVAAGMAWLDKHVPDWLERIDLEVLMLSSCERCVLGQLFGDYHDAPYDVSNAYAAPDPGFDRGSDEYGSLPYADLTAEWRRVIQERRTQAEATS